MQGSPNSRPASASRWLWQCRRTIGSDMVEARRLLDQILTQLKTRGWCAHDVFGVHLAVDEALVNAIAHGNGYDASKQVHVVCGLNDERIRVEITDQGPGFAPDALPDPTGPDRLECPGGRGVLLMRAFMNRVDFNPTGNHVCLEKQRQAQ